MTTDRRGGTVYRVAAVLYILTVLSVATYVYTYEYTTLLGEHGQGLSGLLLLVATAPLGSAVMILGVELGMGGLGLAAAAVLAAVLQALVVLYLVERYTHKSS